MIYNIDLRHHFDKRNRCRAAVNIGNGKITGGLCCLRSAQTVTNVRPTRNVDGRTRRYGFLIRSHDKADVAAVDVNGYRAICGARDASLPQSHNIAIVIFCSIKAAPQFDVSCVDRNALLNNRIACTIDICHMRTVRIDGDIASNIAAKRSVNLRKIICSGFRVSIPAPDVLISINRNIAANRIIAARTQIARAANRPVAVQTQNAVGVFIIRRTGYDMQITANDGFVSRLFRSDNARYPPRTDIECYISSHFAAVCAFNGGACFAVFVVINQRRVAADINVRAVSAISAAAVSGHTAGVHVVSTLHLNIARDFQIGIAIYRVLIRAADHVMQAAVGRRVNITARRDNDMRAGYRRLITAAVKRFLQMNLAVFGEDRIIAVAEQPSAGHVDVVERAVALQNAIAGKREFLHLPF